MFLQGRIGNIKAQNSSRSISETKKPETKKATAAKPASSALGKNRVDHVRYRPKPSSAPGHVEKWRGPATERGWHDHVNPLKLSKKGRDLIDDFAKGARSFREHRKPRASQPERAASAKRPASATARALKKKWASVTKRSGAVAELHREGSYVAPASNNTHVAELLRSHPLAGRESSIPAAMKSLRGGESIHMAEAPLAVGGTFHTTLGMGSNGSDIEIGRSEYTPISIGDAAAFNCSTFYWKPGGGLTSWLGDLSTLFSNGRTGGVTITYVPASSASSMAKVVFGWMPDPQDPTPASITIAAAYKHSVLTSAWRSASVHITAKQFAESGVARFVDSTDSYMASAGQFFFATQDGTATSNDMGYFLIHYDYAFQNPEHDSHATLYAHIHSTDAGATDETDFFANSTLTSYSNFNQRGFTTDTAGTITAPGGFVGSLRVTLNACHAISVAGSSGFTVGGSGGSLHAYFRAKDNALATQPYSETSGAAGTTNAKSYMRSCDWHVNNVLHSDPATLTIPGLTPGNATKIWFDLTLMAIPRGHVDYVPLGVQPEEVREYGRAVCDAALGRKPTQKVQPKNFERYATLIDDDSSLALITAAMDEVEAENKRQADQVVSAEIANLKTTDIVKLIVCDGEAKDCIAVGREVTLGRALTHSGYEWAGRAITHCGADIDANYTVRQLTLQDGRATIRIGRAPPTCDDPAVLVNASEAFYGGHGDAGDSRPQHPPSYLPFDPITGLVTCPDPLAIAYSGKEYACSVDGDGAGMCWLMGGQGVVEIPDAAMSSEEYRYLPTLAEYPPPSAFTSNPYMDLEPVTPLALPHPPTTPIPIQTERGQKWHFRNDLLLQLHNDTEGYNWSPAGHNEYVQAFTAFLAKVERIKGRNAKRAREEARVRERRDLEWANHTIDAMRDDGESHPVTPELYGANAQYREMETAYHDAPRVDQVIVGTHALPTKPQAGIGKEFSCHVDGDGAIGGRGRAAKGSRQSEGDKARAAKARGSKAVHRAAVAERKSTGTAAGTTQTAEPREAAANGLRPPLVDARQKLCPCRGRLCVVRGHTHRYRNPVIGYERRQKQRAQKAEEAKKGPPQPRAEKYLPCALYYACNCAEDEHYHTNTQMCCGGDELGAIREAAVMASLHLTHSGLAELSEHRAVSEDAPYDVRYEPILPSQRMQHPEYDARGRIADTNLVTPTGSTVTSDHTPPKGETGAAVMTDDEEERVAAANRPENGRGPLKRVRFAVAPDAVAVTDEKEESGADAVHDEDPSYNARVRSLVESCAMSDADRDRATIACRWHCDNRDHLARTLRSQEALAARKEALKGRNSRLGVVTRIGAANHENAASNIAAILLEMEVPPEIVAMEGPLGAAGMPGQGALHYLDEGNSITRIAERDLLYDDFQAINGQRSFLVNWACTLGNLISPEWTRTNLARQRGAKTRAYEVRGSQSTHASRLSIFGLCSGGDDTADSFNRHTVTDAPRNLMLMNGVRKCWVSPFIIELLEATPRAFRREAITRTSTANSVSRPKFALCKETLSNHPAFELLIRHDYGNDASGNKIHAADVVSDSMLSYCLDAAAVDTQASSSLAPYQKSDFGRCGPSPARK